MKIRLSRRWRLALERRLAHLPGPLRSRLYRNAVRLDLQPRPGLTIRIARSLEDHLAAFRLLHDAYVDAGFMAPDRSGLRVNAYQLVPGFRTVVAVDRGRVVATCSIIPDSPLGLPMDKAFDLSACRRQTGGIAEISAMAIAPSHRGRPARLIFPMVRFFYDYARRDLGFGGVVFCLPPRHLHLYEAMLYARPLPGGLVANYGFAGGAPAAAGVLDFARSCEWGRRKYRHAPPRAAAAGGPGEAGDVARDDAGNL